MKIGCIFLIQYVGIMIGGISLDKELQSVRICLKEPGLESGVPIKLSLVGVIRLNNLRAPIF